MPPALHPGFSGPWRPLSALSSTPATFDCLCFFIYREHYGFERTFPTHRAFLSYTLSLTFLIQPTFIKALREPAVLPWNLQGFMLILEIQTWPICFFWFPAIHILHIQKNSFLNSTKYYHKLLKGKSVVYLLLTLFELFLLVQSICKDY